MKRWIGLGVCVLLVGCESVPIQQSIVSDTGIMAKRFVSLSLLRSGMSRAQVESQLGKEVVTGYELIDSKSGEYKPITIVNPQRSETIVRNAKVYIVDYYAVGIKTPDDKVSNDEIVPIVFFNDQLIGSGWDYLNHQIKGN